jgi:hypothetical protein
MLNNFKYWLHNFVFTNSTIPYNSTYTLKTPFTDIEGNNITQSYAVTSNLINSLGYITNSSETGIKIYLGTGNTVETTDETHSLENDVTSSFALGNVTSAVSYLNGKVQLVLTAQYTNNTNEAITINEIGMVLINKRYLSTSYTDRILLDRKSVADGNFTPVTVGAGESKIFVYAIEL